MRLLPVGDFGHVLSPLQGKRIGYVPSLGNVGDQMIDLASIQLFNEFQIDWQYFQIEDPIKVDEIVFGGGGNMGPVYQNNLQLRQQLLATGLPVTVFPQTYNGPESGNFKRVYVRETSSLEYNQDAILAPDLALGWNASPIVVKRRPLGIFLRRDREGLRRSFFNRDPAKMCKTPQQYLDLAASFERIVTDRLHFAICGLIADTVTILLPNTYHKNRSMYHTWLKRLGCQFAESVDDAKQLARTAVKAC